MIASHHLSCRTMEGSVDTVMLCLASMESQSSSYCSFTLRQVGSALRAVYEKPGEHCVCGADQAEYPGRLRA